MCNLANGNMELDGTFSNRHVSISGSYNKERYEPVRKKTNNMGSDRVRHKPGCTVTEDG